MLLRYFDGMHTVAALDALQQVISAGVGGGVHQVQASLIDGDRVQGYQNTDVLHTGILCHVAAVAVYADVFHYVDIHCLALKPVCNRPGGVCHGFQEGILLPIPEMVGVAHTVDIGFSVGGCKTDGQLLQRAAVATHGMSFEVGQNQNAVVIYDVLAYKILFDLYAIGNGKLQVRSFGIQQIYSVHVAPAVVLEKGDMPLGGVARAFVGSVTLYDGAAYMVNYRLLNISMTSILLIVSVVFH